MGPWPPARLALQPASGRTRSAHRRLHHARQNVQRPDRRHARVADARISEARDRARRVDRAHPPRTGGGNRLQRFAGELAVSGRARAALRAGERLPSRQAAAGRRHHRHRAAHLPGEPGVKTFAEWLAFIERQHPKTIALGLERVAEVWRRMQVELRCPVITVGGTNGKGSCCAMFEAMLRAGGYKSGLYTSPHLVRYNERGRIGGVEASDASLCESFAAVDAARADVPLTYFEYGTLAALWL